MRILMLLENEFRRDSRVEKEVRTLYIAGHKVIVAAISFSDLPLKEEREDCTVIRKKISKFTHKSSVGALKFPFYFNFWRSFLKEILEDHKVDAIHVHDLPLCRLATEARKQYNIKVVLDLHENWPALLSVSSHTNTFIGKLLSTEKQWRKYERQCVSEADAVITVAEEMKKRISSPGIDPEKIYVLKNTPLMDSLTEINYERDKSFFTLIYIGGISYHRGLQYVIDGMKILVSGLPVRLWIAGDGKFTSTLKEKVLLLNLQNHVEFFGMVSKVRSEELLKKSDLGLIPHIRSEQSDNSSPNKLFEYMASGLPVLASNCISVKRVLEETNSGMTYLFDSPSDFSSVVRVLYNDREKSDFFSRNGKKAVKEKYNWEKSSESLLRLYSEDNLAEKQDNK